MVIIFDILEVVSIPSIALLDIWIIIVIIGIIIDIFIIDILLFSLYDLDDIDDIKVNIEAKFVLANITLTIKSILFFIGSPRKRIKNKYPKNDIIINAIVL